MPKFQISHAILAAVLIYDTYAARRNKQLFIDAQNINNSLVEENVILESNLKEACAMLGYMSYLIYDSEIELDEFDLIALQNPI